MHLIETYATNCGLQIGKPYIYEKYFPIPFKKYVVIQPFSKPSKNYDLWHDVLEMVHKPLTENGYAIVQIGAKGEQPLPGCANLIGMTDLGQSAFIIRKSHLFIGADSFGAHIASYYNSQGFDNKIVSLYSNNNINNVKPYFGNQNDYRLLEPERKNYKPSYSLEENPKTINLIKPESIAKAILELLGLSYTFPKIETIFVGDKYVNKIIEAVPNQVIDPNNFGINQVIIRADLCDLNLNAIAQQLSVSKSILYLDRPIPSGFLNNFKHRINQIVYRLDYDKNGNTKFNGDFVKELSKSGINFSVISYLNDKDLEAAKFSCMEFAIIYDARTKLPEILNNSVGKYYKSGKIILSNSKVYSSVYALKNNLPSPSFSFSSSIIDEKMIKDSSWQEEYTHFLVFSKNT